MTFNFTHGGFISAYINTERGIGYKNLEARLKAGVML